jgi:hypothetical protein
MPKHFNVFRQMVLGYILIVGLCVGLITPIAQAEAPIDTSYNASSTVPVLVDGLTQSERGTKIDAFFTDRGNLPLAGYGLDMVQAADKYGIDWKLVAAISYNESTGGLHECPAKNGKRSFNAFGYGGCSKKFPSYEVAIDTVSRNLAGEIPSTAKYYDNKSIGEIIDVYNAQYKKLVLWTMNKIASTETSSSSHELALAK